MKNKDFILKMYGNFAQKQVKRNGTLRRKENENSKKQST
jgi:hypothetical protein